MHAQQWPEDEELVGPEQEHTQPCEEWKGRYHEQAGEVADAEWDEWGHAAHCDTHTVGRLGQRNELIGFICLFQRAVEAVHEHLHVILSNTDEQECDQFVDVAEGLAGQEHAEHECLHDRDPDGEQPREHDWHARVHAVELAHDRKTLDHEQDDGLH